MRGSAQAMNITNLYALPFARSFFPQLEGIPPESGAKRLIMKYPAQVGSVPLDAAAADVDTPADFERLVSGGE